MPEPSPDAGTTPEPTPEPTPEVTPEPAKPTTPALWLLDPVNILEHLMTLGGDLVSGMVDAFWSFLALFTDGDVGLVDFAGRDLSGFQQPVLTIDNAAAIPPDAVRLARQATFGPTPQVVTRIAALGIPGWVEEQFQLRGSSYADLATFVPNNYCAANKSVPNCTITHLSRGPVAARFYANAMLSPDQLRQRVAFALGQIIPTSIIGNNRTYGMAGYQQMLLNNAFGNYRTLLEDVTLSGYMGSYLSMANSTRAAPSENYARELLQLFSMGPVALNRDGTPILAANGATTPNYTEADVRAISRALTGWTYDRSNGIADWTGWDYTKRMIPRASWSYDSDAKAFLGASVPAGASPEQSVAVVLDVAFNHPSTPPRISTLLIQHLVKSNPSPAYVGRVARVFEDNGAGVRGDMKSIIRAVLLDPEARGGEPRTADSGKIKEPALVMTSLARAVGLFSDGVAFVQRDTALGQPMFQSPSVFNYYSSDYPLPRSSTLRSPASQLLTVAGGTASQNFVYDWTILGNETRGDWNFDMGMPNFSGTRPIWTGWETIGTDVDRMVAIVNLLMLNNSATDAQKAALRNAALSITDKDATKQARRRAQALIYIAASTPNFLVDR